MEYARVVWNIHTSTDIYEEYLLTYVIFPTWILYVIMV
jgi:hypothetical protein